MKSTTITYWAFTGLMSAMMTMASIPDIILHPDAVAMISHLGYPKYLIPFIGVLKLAAVITILLPGIPKIKEWAYAGLVFDLVGAVYSHISVGDDAGVWTFPVVALLLVIGSYVFHLKKEML